MKNLSLKVKLLILVMVTVIPMLILHSQLIVTQREQLVLNELESSQEYAGAISTAYLNYLEDIWSSELAIGTLINEHPAVDYGRMNTYLTKCISGYPTCRNFSWTNPQGIVVSSSNPGAIGLDFADIEPYKRILNGEEKVVSNVTIGRTSKIPTITIARGIRENGELKGILFASVDITKLGSVLPSNRFGETSSFGLIDKNGMIVFRSGTPDLTMEKRQIREDSPAWKALRGEIVKTGGYVSSVDGTLRMGVNYPIPQIGWASFATVSTEEVLKEANSEADASIITMLLIVIVSIAAALYLIIDLLNPIDALRKAAAAIASRNFSFRINLKRKDELGQTAAAFDSMAEHVQELESGRMLFLQSTAHELRNPMASVKGITSLIHHRIDSGKPINSSAELVEALEKEVNRLSRLLNEMIEAFRVESQNIEINFNMRPINIVDVVNSAVSIFKMDSSINRDIVNNCSGEILVNGDFQRLEDVVRNLIGNAVKYSAEMTEIRIDINRQSNNVTISVKDQGIGIPEDQLDKIFISFYRVRNMNGKDPGGLGLGLYICKDIIIRHGGSIWAVNNCDAGSTFFISLPICQGQ